MPDAPTATLPPSALTDTGLPNRSLAVPSAAVSFADVDAAVHPLDGLVNTYAAPLSPTLPSPLADPTTIVLPSPLTDTESPNHSPSAPSDAVSLALVVVADDDHPVAGLVNT